MNNVSISIVTFNNDQAELDELLKSLLNSTITPDIFISDNSRDEKIKEYINSKKISYFKNSKNLGFGPGHNKIISKIKESDYKYHIIANPDILVNQRTIEMLYNYMEHNKDIGLIMPNVNYPNGETQHLCKLLPTPADLILRRFSPFKKYINRKNKKYELKFTGYNKIMDIPVTSGAFMFARTSVLKKIKGFDERFFMYNEDVDLCRRINKISRIVFYPKTTIIHDYAKGSYKNKKLLRYHILSAIKYFNKWGWIFDSERKQINKRTLDKLSSDYE